MKNDPYEIFYSWYLPVASSGIENSNAVVLSTASVRGRVSSRIVLLKEYDRDGFVFFTNYNSRKGRDLEINRMASLLFYWPDRVRQVRVEGMVEKTTAAELDNYFNSRLPGRKINAVVSRQSEPIKDIEEYRKKLVSAREFYSDNDPVRPNYWGGYRLVPDRFEFWEEGEGRFHHRQEFLYDGEFWSKQLLQP